jgi:predicted DNA-binding helix-hairpin-helix protein
VDINRADYEMILRVPGVGVKSAKKIVSSRRFQRLTLDHLKQMGVALKRARYFIDCPGAHNALASMQPVAIRQAIIATDKTAQSAQLGLFG